MAVVGSDKFRWIPYRSHTQYRSQHTDPIPIPHSCQFAGYGNIPSHRNCSTCEAVRTYRASQLAEELSVHAGRRVHFDTLVVDCEGCFRRFLSEEPDFLRDQRLKYIFYEADEKSIFTVDLHSASYSDCAVFVVFPCVAACGLFLAY
jgi:hypothetical protein